MTDEDRIRELIRHEMEQFIKQHGWPDEYVQQALLEVARDHLWKQGLMVKIRYWTNVIGFLGIAGGALAFIVSVLGYDVVPKR